MDALGQLVTKLIKISLWILAIYFGFGLVVLIGGEHWYKIFPKKVLTLESIECREPYPSNGCPNSR